MGKKSDEHVINCGMRRLSRAIRKRKKRIPQVLATKSAILLDMYKRLLYKGIYEWEAYDSVRRDPDLSNLISLLYIWHLVGLGKVPSKEAMDASNLSLLIAIAEKILAGSYLMALWFLREPSCQALRDAIKQYMSLPWFSECQLLKSEEEEAALKLPCNEDEKLDRTAEKLYTSFRRSFQDPVVREEMGHDNCFPPLSDEEISFLLSALQHSAFRQLLFPCCLHTFMSHRDVVQDGIEIARLVLLDVDVNILWGCNFTYSDLKAAVGYDVEEAAVRKLENASLLLRFLQPSPSGFDKGFRCNYLKAQLSDEERSKFHYVTPKDFPESVPPDFLADDITEQELRAVRAIPFFSNFVPPWDTVEGQKAFLMEVHIRDAPTVVDMLEQQEFPRRIAVMSVLQSLEKALPAPDEVYTQLLSLDAR